jgi:hypothetical protein
MAGREAVYNHDVPDVGDEVEFPGDTQDFLLVDPEKVYRGTVIGKDNGVLLVRLDEPVVRGSMEFREASVFENRARVVSQKK